MMLGVMWMETTTTLLYDPCVGVVVVQLLDTVDCNCMVVVPLGDCFGDIGEMACCVDTIVVKRSVDAVMYHRPVVHYFGEMAGFVDTIAM